MSDVNVVNRIHTMDANDTYIIKWGQLPKRPRTYVMHLEDASDDGTYTVNGRPEGSTAAFEPIPYQSLHLNGSAGTGGLVTTGITDDSLIAIEADGLEIALVRSGGSTGATTLTLAVSSMAP